MRTERGGNWTWSGAWCADDGCARGVAGRASALDVGIASLIIRGRCPHGEANETQAKGSGPAVRWNEAVRRPPLRKTKLHGPAEWGDCPKACNKQKSVPGKPPRYATVVGPGTQPAGWAGDRRRKADRGRRAKVEDTSKSCGPGVVEQPGVSEMHLAVGLK